MSPSLQHSGGEASEGRLPHTEHQGVARSVQTLSPEVPRAWMLSQLRFALCCLCSSPQLRFPLECVLKLFPLGDAVLVWAGAGGASSLLESLEQASLPCAHSKSTELGIGEKTMLLVSNNPGTQLEEAGNEAKVCS